MHASPDAYAGVFLRGRCHDAGSGRDAVKAATRAARDRMAKSSNTTDWFAEGLHRIRECFDHVQAGRVIPVDELAWLGVLLTSVLIRDIAFTFCRAYGDDVARRLWTEVACRVEPEFVPAPAANLAFLAARSDDLALARAAAERALTIDPEYSFANLIMHGLNMGVPPARLRDIDLDDLAAQITERAMEHPAETRPVLPPAPDPS
ncbi:DUF4192 domain-containing protein [Nonomuraea sp. NBC_00507]|uniref:DUF4192 family protein n=1 Tax=Nonomuraea sp. NBC_00507 TaxID=2976002 RepID=UPI002E182E83